jgi:hypothetical protein
MARWKYVRESWRQTRRESLRYRLVAARLSWQARQVCGPEPLWSM